MATTMSGSPFTIFCLLISHEKVIISPAFYVRLESGEYIADLKDKVKEKIEMDVRAVHLTVWKLSQPRPIEELTPDFVASIQYVDERSESVNQDQTAFRLDAAGKIGKQGPWPDDEVIHVLVQYPDIDEIAEPLRKKKKIDDALIPDDSDPARNHAKFIQARERDVELARSALPPSATATMPAFLDEQENKPIFNNRPSNNFGLPIGLFHPVFNSFASDMRSDDIDMDPKTLSVIREFLTASACIYSSKDDRIAAINPLLAVLLGRKIQMTCVPGAQSDGIVSETCGCGSAYLVIEEVENEIGTGAADPTHEAGFAYRKYWREQPELRKLTHCPSIILAIAGPWICVLGAIYLEKVVVQPLTDYIWLAGDIYNYKQLSLATRLFAALKTAIHSLRMYYRGIEQRLNEPNLQAEISEFPFITEYDSTKFTYVSRLALNYPDKILYEAKLDDGHRVVVKFVPIYHAEAHRLLAERGLAPKLHYAGTEGGSLYGGRYMVVMDFFEGTMPHTLTEGHFNKVKEAIDLLHSHSIVFGDLRTPNLLAKGEDVMLIDFDWCGKEGEARYPVRMNVDSELGWAQGVGPGCVNDDGT